MAKSFKGEHNHSIDAKGRVSVPSKFRDLLGESFTVTKGREKCLWVFPQEEWDAFEEKLESLPTATDKSAAAFKRFFLTGAEDVEPDKQGRILLPQSLRDYAGLDKDVVFLGVGNKAEIWSRAAWDAYTAEDDIDNYSEHLETLGFQF